MTRSAPLLLLVLLWHGSAFAVAPLIGDVVTCGTAGTAGGLQDGTTMQRVDLDLGAFPQALCNDGSGAVFYFRPATDSADENRWLIQLQGGGGCGTGQGCAERWCMIDTAFSMVGMTSNEAPVPGIDGKGIMDGRPANPIASWNHVFVRYCSSDAWASAQADVELQADLPQGTVDYRIHFLGRRILEATIDTLRQDGVPGLVYTQGGANLPLPDLDDAETVVLSGASAGGNGVIQTVDDTADHLRANNSACAGAVCPLEVRALIDSSFGPAFENLDFSQSVACAASGACDWQGTLASSNTAYTRQSDASCTAWHQQNAPGTEWQCEDPGHVVRHHVTTPFFVRMGQEDALLSSAYIAAGYAEPGGIPLDLARFAGIVRTELAALADIQTTGHEGAAIGTTPGVFGPTCPEHETLRNNPQTYSATIWSDGAHRALFDVFEAWRSGPGTPTAITMPGGFGVCPGVGPLPVSLLPRGVMALVGVLLSILVLRLSRIGAARARSCGR